MLVEQVLLVVALVALNGFLAMSELAIVCARRAGLQRRAVAGSRGARIAIQLADDPTRFLSTVQMGITASRRVALHWRGGRRARFLVSGDGRARAEANRFDQSRWDRKRSGSDDCRAVASCSSGRVVSADFHRRCVAPIRSEVGCTSSGNRRGDQRVGRGGRRPRLDPPGRATDGRAGSPIGRSPGAHNHDSPARHRMVGCPRSRSRSAPEDCEQHLQPVAGLRGDLGQLSRLRACAGARRSVDRAGPARSAL